MKYLVLGSSGQIGEPLCRHLKSEKNDVVEFDILMGTDYDIRSLQSGLLESSVRDADFVYFLAYDVGGTKYLSKYQDTFEFIQNNVKIMSNTFELLRLYKKRFIFATSQMSNMTHSTYGITKLLGEKYTESLGGLPVKFWNVYGPEKDFEKSHVITDFIVKSKSKKKIEMLSDGKEKRQFLHVDDCSRALLRLSKIYSDIDKSKQYHVTSFEWSSILEIASLVSSHYGNVEVLPSDKVDNIQRGVVVDPDNYILRYWKPEISLDVGIKRVIDFYEESCDKT